LIIIQSVGILPESFVVKELFEKLFLVLSSFLFSFLFLQLNSLSCIAQYSEQTNINYTVNDGLQSMTTYDILQDDNGYIWVATEAGLSKFNGNNFKNFGLKEGLVQNEVVKLDKDTQDRIWLNTSGSPSFLKNDSITVLNVLESSNLHWNYRVVEETDNLWILCKNFLFRLDHKTLEFKTVPPPFNMETKTTTLIGNYNDQLLMINSDTLSFIKDGIISNRLILPYILKNEDAILFQKFFLDKDYVYYNSNEGLIKFDLISKSHEIIDPEPLLSSLLLKYDNFIFMSDKNMGVIMIELDDEGKLIKKSNLLDGKLCSNIYIDKLKNLWVAAYGSGVYLFPYQDLNVQHLQKVGKVKLENLETILIDKDVVWMGQMNGQLLRFQNNKLDVFKIPQKTKKSFNRILDIEKIGEEELLLSTDIGILHFKNRNFRHLLISSSKKIFVREDTLVISTSVSTFSTSLSHVLSLKEPVFLAHYSKEHASSFYNGRSYAALMDSKNKLWIGNISKGIMKVEENQNIEYFGDSNNLFKASASDIIEMDNGNICISTNGEGILIINDDGKFQIDIESGMPTDITYELDAEKNKLFAASNMGIAIVNFDESNPNSYSIEIVDRLDGLPTNEVRDIEYQDGKLYLGTPDGLVIYDIINVEEQEFVYPIQIEEIKVNDEPQRINTSFLLEPHQNNIQIDFQLLSFIRNKQSVYAYMMQGVDEDWIVTKSNDAHYSNLEPGKYKFYVKNHMTENEKSTLVQKISFEIKETFFQSIWFKGTLFIFTILLSYFIFQYFNKRKQNAKLEALVLEKTNTLNEKLDDLKLVNNRLEKSNTELERFAYITSHDLKSPLRSVGSFVQLLLRKNQAKFDAKDIDYINYITGGVTRMEHIIKDLLILSRVGKSHDIVEEISIKSLVEDVVSAHQYLLNERNASVQLFGEFPTLMVNRIEFEQLFQNFITNGLKYNDKEFPLIQISCKQEDSNWKFSIIDNGIGIDQKYGESIFNLFTRLHTEDQYSGTGIGLSICKKIIESHQGAIGFSSDLGQGSTFFFTFPANKGMKNEWGEESAMEVAGV